MKLGWLMGLEPTTTGITIFGNNLDLALHPAAPMGNFADFKGADALSLQGVLPTTLDHLNGTISGWEKRQIKTNQTGLLVTRSASSLCSFLASSTSLSEYEAISSVNGCTPKTPARSSILLSVGLLSPRSSVLTYVRLEVNANTSCDMPLAFRMFRSALAKLFGYVGFEDIPLLAHDVIYRATIYRAHF